MKYLTIAFFKMLSALGRRGLLLVISISSSALFFHHLCDQQFQIPSYRYYQFRSCHRNFLPVVGIYLLINKIVLCFVMPEKPSFGEDKFLPLIRKLFLWEKKKELFQEMQQSVWFSTKISFEISIFPGKILPTFPGNIPSWLAQPTT